MQFSETKRHSQIQNKFRDLGSEYSFCFGECRFVLENCVFVSEFRVSISEERSWFQNFQFHFRNAFQLENSEISFENMWFLFQNTVRTLRFRRALCGTLQPGYTYSRNCQQPGNVKFVRITQLPQTFRYRHLRRVLNVK